MKKVKLVILFMLICSCLAIPVFASSRISSSNMATNTLYYGVDGSLVPICTFDELYSKGMVLKVGVQGRLDNSVEYDVILNGLSIMLYYRPYSSSSSLTFGCSNSNISYNYGGGAGYRECFLSFSNNRQVYYLTVKGGTKTDCTLTVSSSLTRDGVVFAKHCDCGNLHKRYEFYIDGELVTSNFKNGFTKKLSYGKHTYKLIGYYENIFIGTPTTATGSFTVDEKLDVTSYEYDQSTQMAKFKFDCFGSYDNIYVRTSNGLVYSTFTDSIRLAVSLHSGDTDYITYWFTYGDFKSKEFTYNYEIPPWGLAPSKPHFRYVVSKDYKTVDVYCSYNSWEDVSSFKINGSSVENNSVLTFDYVENSTIKLDYVLSNTFGNTSGVYSFDLGSIPKPRIISLSYSEGLLHFIIVNNDFGYPVTLVLDGVSHDVTGSTSFSCGDLAFGRHFASLTCGDSSKTLNFTLREDGLTSDIIQIIIDSILGFLETLKGYGVYIIVSIIAFALIFFGGRWLWSLFKIHVLNDSKINLKTNYDPYNYKERIIKKTNDGYVSNYGVVYKSVSDFRNSAISRSRQRPHVSSSGSSYRRAYNKKQYYRKGRY